jgi:HEAT repeat protein
LPGGKLFLRIFLTLPAYFYFTKNKNASYDSKPYARNVLANLEIQKAQDALYQMLDDKNVETEMRAWAASALGQLKNKQAFNLLLKILEDQDENSDIRYSTARALGYLDEKKVVKNLLLLVKKEEDLWVCKGIIGDFVKFCVKGEEAQGEALRPLRLPKFPTPKFRLTRALE